MSTTPLFAWIAMAWLTFPGTWLLVIVLLALARLAYVIWQTNR